MQYENRVATSRWRCSDNWRKFDMPCRQVRHCIPSVCTRQTSASSQCLCSFPKLRCCMTMLHVLNTGDCLTSGGILIVGYVCSCLLHILTQLCCSIPLLTGVALCCHNRVQQLSHLKVLLRIVRPTGCLPHV